MLRCIYWRQTVDIHMESLISTLSQSFPVEGLFPPVDINTKCAFSLSFCCIFYVMLDCAKLSENTETCSSQSWAEILPIDSTTTFSKIKWDEFKFSLQVLLPFCLLWAPEWLRISKSVSCFVPAGTGFAHSNLHHCIWNQKLVSRFVISRSDKFRYIQWYTIHVCCSNTKCDLQFQRVSTDLTLTHWHKNVFAQVVQEN